jgi:hypothetical protein
LGTEEAINVEAWGENVATSESAESCMRIAIVGMGPRGISILERLAARKAGQSGRRVHVSAIDQVEVGAGRVWRTDQPEWLTMNTVASQVTMYTDGRDGGPDRAGHGPSLYEWLADDPDPRLAAIGPDGYAPRAAYGRYLRDVYRNICARLPENMRVETITGSVGAVRRLDGGSFCLEIGTETYTRLLQFDQVVLTTGHPLIKPTGTGREFAQFAARNPGLRFIAGDSAADMPLERIGRAETVGMLGMGLTFYDVLLSLTVGRGGRFEQTAEGLRYKPGGSEPAIVAGSRSGLPIPARGANQKPSDHVHKSAVFTVERVRAHQGAIDGPGAPLDFRRHMMPFIQAEIDHTYLTSLVREARGPAASERFAGLHAELLQAGRPTGELRREFGLPEGATLDLEALARPFTKMSFESPDHFHEALLGLMRTDIAEAMRGNLDGPVKASLDVLRDIRNVIRELVDYGGLGPASHRDDFLGWYVPINAMLSAGPPVERAQQLVALIEAGIVTIIGPRADFSIDTARGAFVISSPDVAGARIELSVLIDARIPQPDLLNDLSPLYRQLVADGIAREFVARGSGIQTAFPTGGLEVTRPPFRLVDRSGKAVPGLYALGLPTEHLRWFNQIGNGRPHSNTLFLRDADSIAESILSSPAPRAAAGVAAPAHYIRPRSAEPIQDACTVGSAH